MYGNVCAGSWGFGGAELPDQRRMLARSLSVPGKPLNPLGTLGIPRGRGRGRGRGRVTPKKKTAAKFAPSPCVSDFIRGAQPVSWHERERERLPVSCP